MAWAGWLVYEPTLEQELELEKQALAIKEDGRHEEVAQLAAALTKQTFYQQQIIQQSIYQIRALEAKVICLSNPVKQPDRPWWRIF